MIIEKRHIRARIALCKDRILNYKELREILGLLGGRVEGERISKWISDLGKELIRLELALAVIV